MPPPPVSTPVPSSKGKSTQTLPPVGTLPPDLDVRVEPSAIQEGESALLSWEVHNADQVSISENIGPVGLTGKIKFFPEETTTYTVTAEGLGGRIAKSVTVEVLGSGSGRISVEDLDEGPLEERFKYFVKPVFFGFDSAELTEEARLTLEGNIRWLIRPDNASLRFTIQGHCDEQGTEEYNLALGDKRATVVKEYLVARGIEASRITAVSLGEERPFDLRSTEEAWALNRRAHFVLASDIG